MKPLAERARRRARGRVSGPLLIWALVLLTALMSFVVHLLGDRLMHRAQILQLAQAAATGLAQPLVPMGKNSLLAPRLTGARSPPEGVAG